MVPITFKFGSVRMLSCSCIATFIAYFVALTEKIVQQNHTQANMMTTVCLPGSADRGIIMHKLNMNHAQVIASWHDIVIGFDPHDN